MEVVSPDTFFQWIFAQTLAASPNLKLNVWTLPGRKSHFCSSTKEAADYALKVKNGKNVYFGLGALSRIPTDGKDPRGNLSDIGAISCVWADIDIAGTGHKKENLPPDVEHALMLLNDMKVEPSIVVHSGGGLQAYWLFTKPWLLPDDEARKRAGAFTKAWHGTLQTFALKRGWKLDSVFDLTRVLRVPGTLNCKDPSNPKPVQVIEPRWIKEPRRYSYKDLEAILIPEELSPDRKVSARSAPMIEIDPVLPNTEKAEEPPIVKAMCENDKKFRLTWERKRTDFQDGTPSSYDMSIATMMVLAGCVDQDIADAIYQWRLKHGNQEDIEKGRRRDYLMRTIRRARLGHESASAIARVAAKADDPPVEDPESEEAQEIVQETVKGISTAFGIQVASVIKLGKSKSVYSLVLADGEHVKLGSAEAITNQARVRASLIDATSTVIPLVKQDQWLKFVQAMLRAAILIENPEGDEFILFSEYLSMFLANNPAIDSTDPPDSDFLEAFFKRANFRRGESLFVAADSLMRFMRVFNVDKFERADVWEFLRGMGFQSGPVTIWDKDKHESITRNYWHANEEHVTRCLSSMKRNPKVQQASVEPVPGGKNESAAI